MYGNTLQECNVARSTECSIKIQCTEHQKYCSAIKYIECSEVHCTPVQCRQRRWCCELQNIYKTKHITLRSICQSGPLLYWHYQNRGTEGNQSKPLSPCSCRLPDRGSSPRQGQPLPNKRPIKIRRQRTTSPFHYRVQYLTPLFQCQGRLIVPGLL